MPTRRQVLETCLVAERQDLWTELDLLIADDDTEPDATSITNLITRIRRAGEALGYSTPWEDIPVPSLGWHALVETDPTNSIYVTPPPWPELLVITETTKLHGVPFEAVLAHGLDGKYHVHYALPGDPDEERPDH